MKRFVATCLVLLSSMSFAGFYSAMDLAIKEAVEKEFVATTDLPTRLTIFKTITVTKEVDAVEGCDFLYQGELEINRQPIYFDACVLVEGRRSFHVSISERGIND